MINKLFLLFLLFYMPTVNAEDIIYYKCLDVHRKPIIANSTDGLSNCIKAHIDRTESVENVEAENKEDGFLYFIQDTSGNKEAERIFSEDEVKASAKFEKDNAIIFENAVKKMKNFNNKKGNYSRLGIKPIKK